jgi:hypothetical protein
LSSSPPSRPSAPRSPSSWTSARWKIAFGCAAFGPVLMILDVVGAALLMLGLLLATIGRYRER